MVDWVTYYRRRIEVAAADKRQREMHFELWEHQRMVADLAQMAVEDTISAEVQARLRAQAEMGRRRSIQEQSDRVIAARKLRQQEEARTQSKRERAAAQQEAASRAWDAIAAKVAVEVRQSTIEWFTTREGRAAEHTEAGRIYDQDPKVLRQQLQLNPQAMALPGCRWQLCLEEGYGGDSRLAQPYYLNVETFEKFMCDELVMDNCEAIAREVIIQRRIDEALVRVQGKQTALALATRQQAAALTIQMLFKCRHALKLSRSLVRAQFVKRIEPRTGDVVYFDIPRQQTRRRPPTIMGNDEPTIPVESATWVRRIDDDGHTYYARIDQPDVMSWSPPDHFALCCGCRANFASRRCTASGERVCVVCFAERRRREPADAWTKLPVQPQNCVVCRNAPAEVLCHDCRGDVTCSRCYQIVHQHKLKQSHTKSDPLVNRGYIDA